MSLPRPPRLLGGGPPRRRRAPDPERSRLAPPKIARVLGALALLCAAPVAAAEGDPPSAQPPPPPSPTATDLPEALDQPVDPATYPMGPGDRLRVDLWGVENKSDEVDVSVEGSLFIPRVGVFRVLGKTLAQLRRDVEHGMRMIYPHLRVNVTLSRPRTFLVHVAGAVARPGSYPVTPLTRLSTLLPRAVPLPNASTRRIEIRHRDASQAPGVGDLVRFTALGDSKGNPTLQQGDTVYVPMRSFEVEVSGAVNRPGRYELVGTKDLGELLELAGGLDTNAASTLPLRIASRGPDDHRIARSVPLPAPGAPGQPITLAPGDAVSIPAIGDLHRVVVVEGAIVGGTELPRAGADSALEEHRPETTTREAHVALPFVEGLGVRDAITRVGGLSPWADPGAAFLLRPSADGGRQRLPVDANAILAGQSPDVSMASGDTLVVPSRRDGVVVGGAIYHPGLYPYRPDLRPLDYIAMAGGPTRNGLPDSAVVVRHGGKPLTVRRVAAIEPGDIISVPETRITGPEWVQITAILANMLVASSALIVSLTYRP